MYRFLKAWYNTHWLYTLFYISCEFVFEVEISPSINLTRKSKVDKLLVCRDAVACDISIKQTDVEERDKYSFPPFYCSVAVSIVRAQLSC